MTMRARGSAMTRTTLILGTACLLPLGLAGCSGNDSGNDGGATDNVTDASGQVSQKTIAQPPALTKLEGARKDLTDAQCEADSDGAWSASGRITNSAKTDLTYVVSYSVALKKGGTVRGRAMETLDLKPGESKDIEKTKFFTTKEADLHCVITVTRGTKAPAGAASATRSASGSATPSTAATSGSASASATKRG